MRIVWQHPDPIGVGLANEIAFECGGSDCLIPGLVRPTRVLGLQVIRSISLVARSISMLLECALSRFFFRLLSLQRLLVRESSVIVKKGQRWGLTTGCREMVIYFASPSCLLFLLEDCQSG